MKRIALIVKGKEEYIYIAPLIIREMWTAGFRFSWRKMETAAQDRAGWRRVVCGLCSTGSVKA